MITDRNELIGLISALLIMSAFMFFLLYDKPNQDELRTLYQIKDIQQWIQEDCKKMTLADFRIETLPENLKGKARALADTCMSSNKD